MWKSWLKKLAGWIIRFGPGVAEAVIEAKMKKGGENPPKQ